MKAFNLLTFILLCIATQSVAQGPEITSWLQNTEETGTYYTAGNPTLIENNILVNCQQVEYSDDYVFVTCTGVPAYPTGPFQDGNPSQASNQERIYRITRNPVEGSGDEETTPGPIGAFINGVALYDYRDGVAWNPITNALCGGPGNPPCPGGMGADQDWNRDAIPAELPGFDCAKGHPAMGDYHHHQNPMAFDMDLVELSDVCDVHAADGLYVIDETVHSPLIGYAFDGFPIYGAYAYSNTDGTGEIVRMKSGYSLRDITVRNTHADGTAVSNGADVSATYPLGYFREDYEFIASDEPDVLDEHNGRWCVTPEYPEGIYAYFCTVDEDWNSAYPYAVGPTFYGDYQNSTVNTINENTTIYTGTDAVSELEDVDVSVFPNPASDMVTAQVGSLAKENILVSLMDITGKIIEVKQITAGSTLVNFDVSTLYAGKYILVMSSAKGMKSEELLIMRN